MMHDRRNRHDLPEIRKIDRLVSRVVSEVRLGDAKLDEALEHYRNAGQHLIDLKADCEHGEFTTATRQIRNMLRISERRVQHLMKLAREWPVSWDRWQEIQGHKKPDDPKPKSPKPDDAAFEYARKIIAKRDDPATPEGERENARAALKSHAETFGMSPDVMETKAADDEAKREPFEARVDRLYTEYMPQIWEATKGWERNEFVSKISYLEATIDVLKGND